MSLPNRKEWIHFAESAWSAAGRPGGLHPSVVESDPIAYDNSYYGYFERRFIDIWMNVYRQVKPDTGTLIKEESSDFRAAWRRNFSWETTWKQLLPLFVYGTVVGVDNEVLTALASCYCIAQAIPSVVIDRMLDEPESGTSASDAAFCMLCYSKGVSGMRSLRLPCLTALEDCFVRYTCEMYDLMLTENANRFVLPPLASEAISGYFSGKSRLLSSVFYAILPRWAYLLMNQAIPAAVEDSLGALRSVRQLNDELSDVHSDLARGLVTLPWLYALDEAPKLRELIKKLWRQPGSTAAREACRARLHSTDAMSRAWTKSLDLLSRSMDATRACFRASNAFDLIVLHNVRWAHLMRIAQNKYEDIATPRQPALPHRTLASTSNPIVPVGGAGTLVVNGDGKVLMSLALKRGMLRWELPAGVAKEGESLEHTAERETLEETGCKVVVEGPVALCWHYSRELGKGWMGIFFKARLADKSPAGYFKVIKISAFDNPRVNLLESPELYEPAGLEGYDFELVRERWALKMPRPAAHENILACGFVDWTRIPEGRIHPLHRELLEAYRLDQKVDLLTRDADTDFMFYDKDAPFYLV